jgi:hypothetical protein
MVNIRTENEEQTADEVLAEFSERDQEVRRPGRGGKGQSGAGRRERRAEAGRAL